MKTSATLVLTALLLVCVATSFAEKPEGVVERVSVGLIEVPVVAEGGLIVKIVRPGFNGAGNHASETSLDNYSDWNNVIINDGTLQQFCDKVADLTEGLPV